MAGVCALVLIAVVLAAADGDDQATVTASAESATTASTTTTEPTTTSESTTSTVAPTTTAPPTTVSPTTVPPTTAPPTTAPPPPPITVPAGPTEFAATTRGVDQGPPYYAIFYGQTFGGGGSLHVIADCRPGTVKVTVLEDGWDAPPPEPTNLWVWADGNELFHAGVTDGKVVSGPVSGEVAVRVSNPSEHQIRIKYDCRG
jgi:hypothetical protein